MTCGGGTTRAIARASVAARSASSGACPTQTSVVNSVADRKTEGLTVIPRLLWRACAPHCLGPKPLIPERGPPVWWSAKARRARLQPGSEELTDSPD
jgi:hypothetical protein